MSDAIAARVINPPPGSSTDRLGANRSSRSLDSAGSLQRSLRAFGERHNLQIALRMRQNADATLACACEASCQPGYRVVWELHEVRLDPQNGRTLSGVTRRTDA